MLQPRDTSWTQPDRGGAWEKKYEGKEGPREGKSTNCCRHSRLLGHAEAYPDSSIGLLGLAPCGILRNPVGISSPWVGCGEFSYFSLFPMYAESNVPPIRDRWSGLHEQPRIGVRLSDFAGRCLLHFKMAQLPTSPGLLSPLCSLFYFLFPLLPILLPILAGFSLFFLSLFLLRSAVAVVSIPKPFSLSLVLAEQVDFT